MLPTSAFTMFIVRGKIKKRETTNIYVLVEQYPK